MSKAASHGGPVGTVGLGIQTERTCGPAALLRQCLSGPLKPPSCQQSPRPHTALLPSAEDSWLALLTWPNVLSAALQAASVSVQSCA